MNFAGGLKLKAYWQLTSSSSKHTRIPHRHLW